jgi:hypothetical protein
MPGPSVTARITARMGHGTMGHGTGHGTMGHGTMGPGTHADTSPTVIAVFADTPARPFGPGRAPYARAIGPGTHHGTEGSRHDGSRHG